MSSAPSFRPEFPEGAHRLLAPLRPNHFWFAHRRRRILETAAWCLRDRARPRVLELGCGDGDVLAALATQWWSVGLERNFDDLAALRLRHALRVVAAEGGAPPFAATFDLVGLFDVVEHVEDDAGLLRLASRYVVPGGWILATVPADQRLWTTLDVYAGHYRRYGRDDLRRLFERAGLEVVCLSPLFRVLWPLALLKAAFLRNRPIKDPRGEYQVSAFVNRVLSAGLAAEASLLRSSPAGAGTSWIVAGRTAPPAAQPIARSVRS